MTFLGGVLGLIYIRKTTGRRPKTHPKESYSKCFRRTQIRWVIWRSSRFWIRADFRDGDEDSNFSIFRVRRFTESPGPLHWIAFPVKKPLPNPSFTELPPPFSPKAPFFTEKCFVASPSQKSALRAMLRVVCLNSGAQKRSLAENWFAKPGFWEHCQFFLGKTANHRVH